MDSDLTKEVQNFIGFPPSAVTLDGIKLKFPKQEPGSLASVVMHLVEKDLVGYQNGWFFGKKETKKIELSPDDVDWLLGSGKYSQG